MPEPTIPGPGEAPAGSGAVVLPAPTPALRRTVTQYLRSLPTLRGTAAEFATVMGQLGQFVRDAYPTLDVVEADRLLIQLLVTLRWYGPIQSLLGTPDITDVFVNGPDQALYVVQKGRNVVTDLALSMDWIYFLARMFMAEARTDAFDETHPVLDLRAAGMRVNVAHGSVSVLGPAMSLRRFRSDPYSLDELVEFGALTAEAATWLRAFVAARANILISGGTGSGKTTMLSALVQCTGMAERIVVIEESHEILLPHPNKVYLEASLSADIRLLVRNALRMAPTRLIVGEVRGAEAFDLLNALNTGHSGSFSTIHANSGKDALLKLENYIAQAGVNVPQRAIRRQIGSAIHFIVHLSREANGLRHVVSIDELQHAEDDHFVTGGLFEWSPATQTLEGTGVPLSERRRTELRELGIELPPTARRVFPVTALDDDPAEGAAPPLKLGKPKRPGG